MRAECWEELCSASALSASYPMTILQRAGESPRGTDELLQQSGKHVVQYQFTISSLYSLFVISALSNGKEY